DLFLLDRQASSGPPLGTRQADALATDEAAVLRADRESFLLFLGLAPSRPAHRAGQALAFAAHQPAVVRADRTRLDRLALARLAPRAFVADALTALDMAVCRALRTRLGALPAVPDEARLAAAATGHHPVDGALRRRLFLFLLRLAAAEARGN